MRKADSVFSHIFIISEVLFPSITFFFLYCPFACHFGIKNIVKRDHLLSSWFRVWVLSDAKALMLRQREGSGRASSGME